MTTFKSPTRDNMDIDNEHKSPIRTHTRFSDRYKTLFQESPPKEFSITNPSPKNPLLISSPKRETMPDTRRKSTTIKNEDRGQWREMSSPKKEVKEAKIQEKDTKAAEETPAESKKVPIVIKASKIPSPSTSTATKSMPHYMMTTSSSMSKFRTRNPKASSLGVRSVGKISKRSAAPSKIPKYNKQTVDDEELKRLSFKGTYVTMASRVKSYEKELRPLDNGKVEEGNDNNSRASTPTQSAQTNTPKFKLFKFATSERAKRHKQK